MHSMLKYLYAWKSIKINSAYLDDEYIFVIQTIGINFAYIYIYIYIYIQVDWIGTLPVVVT